MDTYTPATPIIRGLSEADQNFVRAQRVQNFPTMGSGSVSPVQLNDMDFTPTAQGFTSISLQNMKRYAATVEDEDMTTECGDLGSVNDINSDDSMDGIELDRVRKRREQRFSQPRNTIEDFAPASMHQKTFYSRNSLTDEDDPEFGMIIDMDAPNDQWTSTNALQRMALSERILIQGLELSTKRYIYAREPLSRTLAEYERSGSASQEMEKDDPMEDLLSTLSGLGVSGNRADEDVEMG
ncbi:hypothetical protein IFR05_012795 [Cadophora sp. M221]|nr:hypothetical protein IFR05_012795 [Cadophora sp. M221]